MKIEAKLTINNMKQNKKRTIFTIISIILCAVIIFVTMLLISSIKTGIAKNIEKEYNDYHFIIKDINANSLSKIKDKEYIEKIYIKEKDVNYLKKLEKPYNLISTNENIDIYIKYKNVKKEEIISNTVTSEKNEISHFNPTSSFKLVVVKLPWYKKLFNSIKGFLGLGYF